MYTIREGKIEDLPRVLELVKELALYEKAPEQVTNTLEMMQEDGFGPNPIYGLFVAEKNSTGEIIGISIFYYRYSTWKGKRLYLEDIVVTETERGHGAGKLLFDRTMLKCIEANCTGMMWQVLDWNTPAINFYQKYGAELDSGWINCNLQSEDIKKIL
ncbi:GNAT family N-acetyltransferase [Aquiflexum sp. LQ15W]|jgi:GNAT superfamily N-acetyltransferase|uniref:GNAT family N-acetyltransferase n=1 Tax=Aquiflexum gelatinilyticum TaxID=2961943 RepID=A0A9X2P7N7_9BACT|nr:MULTISPECIES: GNAT family N-acetyltransferase [Cyclobacteriaceae]MCH6199601.1 GNAT family N-acetyltransferase [Cognataquiflexum nitidum]MCH6235344.1 GNAT family N-acetyltransferase [Cognataquiflexum rubidum]MCR9016927.1 GNAT family N-acetyltransferase [Aquiflexum gelatinilyticum]